jgi:glycine/D-amino acid oxidase-like deaminating enzyme
MSVSANQNKYDVCVIGGGYMGAAVSLGLVQAGAKVLMIDKVSEVHKASRANFGLVWSQSKGSGNRPYARLSEQAVRDFADFAEDLQEACGIDIELRLGAGLVLSIGEQEFAARSAALEKLHHEAATCGETHPSQLLDRNQVQELVGNVVLGDEVSGGSFSDIDGDVNPLLLLKAIRKMYLKNGGTFIQGCEVESLLKKDGHYQITTPTETFEAEKVVLAAGLGNISLCSKLGITIPVVPQKGQLLVTERVKPFLPLPFSGIRQTGCGTIMIGYTQENTGFDTNTTVTAAARLARRAMQIFPALLHIRVVRSWASLRILTADGLPIYDEIAGYPGCYLLTSHSCVTLASLHSSLLPPWILGGQRPAQIESFNLERFNVTI